jgi:hypothetical protein
MKSDHSNMALEVSLLLYKTTRDRAIGCWRQVQHDIIRIESNGGLLWRLKEPQVSIYTNNILTTLEAISSSGKGFFMELLTDRSYSSQPMYKKFCSTMCSISMTCVCILHTQNYRKVMETLLNIFCGCNKHTISPWLYNSSRRSRRVVSRSRQSVSCL